MKSIVLIKNRLPEQSSPRSTLVSQKYSRQTVFHSILYLLSMSTEEAVSKAYQLASKESIKDVALILRDISFRAFEERDLPWPPSSDCLEVKDGIIPDKL